jgi:putative Holliday junction resolvase
LIGTHADGRNFPAQGFALLVFRQIINFAATMGRILAIDYGTKRTGIAVTDPLRIIANGLDTVPTHNLTAWLAQYLAAENVDIIVVGRPSRMDGSPSETMARIEPLAARLRREYPDKQIVLHDERFTSRLAQRAIIDGGVPKMARRDKALVDRVSATIILQSYLESKDYRDTI